VGQHQALAKREPMLMTLEDMHWIDPTSLEALDPAVDYVRGLAALLVVTFRSEFNPPRIGRLHLTLCPSIGLIRVKRGDRRAHRGRRHKLSWASLSSGPPSSGTLGRSCPEPPYSSQKFDKISVCTRVLSFGNALKPWPVMIAGIPRSSRALAYVLTFACQYIWFNKTNQ
jgi:hypothetical protein